MSSYLKIETRLKNLVKKEDGKKYYGTASLFERILSKGEYTPSEQAELISRVIEHGANAKMEITMSALQPKKLC